MLKEYVDWAKSNISYLRKLNKAKSPKVIKSIKIQANLPEGGSREVMLESFMTGRLFRTSVPGTINAYTTYESQVTETYNKYNGASSFGNQQTRAIVDLRTAFIAGEGISISCEDEATGEWIEDFIQKNRLDGNNFISAVKGSEMAGQSLLLLRPWLWVDDSLYVRVSRVPYINTAPYKPLYKDELFREEVQDMLVRKDGVWVSFGFTNFIYVRTGGDDIHAGGPVTKVGVILTDVENYDRAIKDMRRNNHIFARITPVFETKSASESTALKDKLQKERWRIGTAHIGPAKFSYATPGQGAHENLKSEMGSTIKTVSSVTGIPVHWLGWVDMMSNRSTAKTLYDLIKNGTINERIEWENGMYNLIYKSQELYIDSGGTELPALNPNYQVKLPLIDFEDFAERIKGWSVAYADGAISIDDYRNNVPGIDPMKTKKAIEREKEEAKKEMMEMGIKSEEETEEEEENE